MLFITEQDGSVERKFKAKIKNLLLSYGIMVRAYLVRLSYGIPNEFNVGLCFKTENKENLQLLQDTIKIFRNMISTYEHLDIVFLTQDDEIEIRKICCPFYVSENYQILQPDFYLTSSESYELKEIRACFKRKKLYGKNPDGYMLCDLYPRIIGQKFELGQNDIDQIVLARRHKECSLFSSKINWPLCVHVAIPTEDNIEDVDYIDTSCIRLIGWGEIYQYKEDIKIKAR